MPTCTKCMTQKDESMFSKNKNEKSGYQRRCKECVSIFMADYYKDNKAEAKDRQKKNYEANKESINEYKVKHHLKNKEAANEKSKKWAKDNPKKIAESNAKWRLKNPEMLRIYSQNRRALKRSAGGNLSKGLQQKLFKLQRGRCACCGEILGDNYHMDHIMPLALGGENTDDNIQLLRQRCNNQKHSKDPISFMQSRGFLL